MRRPLDTCTGATCAATGRRELFQGLGVTLADFRCGAAADGATVDEPSGGHSVVLVRRGVFRRRSRDETIVADPTRVLFFSAGEVYGYSHPLPGGDHCTLLTLATARARELVERHADSRLGASAAPFFRGHGASTPRALRLHHELLALVRGAAMPLAIEDTLAELLDETIGTAYGHGAASRRRIAGTLRATRRRRELAEEARIALQANLESPPGLGDLSRTLGSSPFHLSRVFRTVNGVTMRSWLHRLRAFHAAHRLAAGVDDLTELAFDLGYAEHSHFTNAFRRVWGVPPSRYLRPSLAAGESGRERPPTPRRGGRRSPPRGE